MNKIIHGHDEYLKILKLNTFKCLSYLIFKIIIDI